MSELHAQFVLRGALKEYFHVDRSLPDGIQGQYNHFTKVITVRRACWELDTLLHEVGHLIHFQLGEKRLRKMGVKFDREYAQARSDAADRYKDWVYYVEGWAEAFAQHYYPLVCSSEHELQMVVKAINEALALDPLPWYARLWGVKYQIWELLNTRIF